MNGGLLLLATSLLGATSNPPRVVAVFEIEDQTGHESSKKIAEDVTDYLRIRLAETKQFQVIDKGEQEAEVKRVVDGLKLESYAACHDESCQIPIGKELAANLVLRGSLRAFGATRVLSVELLDVATGTSIGAASDRNDGTEEALLIAVDRIVAQLSGTPKSNELPKVAANPEPKIVAVMSPPIPEEPPSPFLGIGLLAGGLAAIGGGVALDVLPASGQNAKLDALDIVPIGLYVVGAIIATKGVFSLLESEL